MAIYEHIPYSNLHNMNLDWILSKMKECVATVEAMSEDVEELQEAVGDLNTLIDALDNRVTNINTALSARIDGAEETALEALDVAEGLEVTVTNKVDKRLTGLEVYAHEGSIQRGYTIGPGENNVPIRHGDGRLYVADPVDATDAANKGYVDAATYTSPITALLNDHEDLDDTYAFTASGTWSVYSSIAYKTVINMTDRPDIRLCNVVRIAIDGTSLVFTRNLARNISTTYECSDSDYRLIVALDGTDITSMQLLKYVNTAPATSTITAVGFSAAYAPMADLALKSEAQDFIFTVDGTPVTYKVVCVDA